MIKGEMARVSSSITNLAKSLRPWWWFSPTGEEARVAVVLQVLQDLQVLDQDPRDYLDRACNQILHLALDRDLKSKVLIQSRSLMSSLMIFRSLYSST